MSKDKGSKNVKKAPSTTGKKAQSEYQAGKSSSSMVSSPSGKKK